MEKGLPLCFAQSDNDRLCSLMSSILQRNVFSDRSVPFLQACEDSFQATAQALASFQCSSRSQQIPPPVLLLIRKENEFHTKVAGKLREALAGCCGCSVNDGKMTPAQHRPIPLIDVYQASNEQQISEILDAFDGKRPLYVISLQSSPLIWLRPVLDGNSPLSSSRRFGLFVALPTVHEMEQIATQFMTAANSMTTSSSTETLPTMMLLTYCSTETVKIATMFQQRVPPAICVLLPDPDETSLPALPAFLTRAILHFVLSHQNLEHPQCRL